MKIKNIDTNKKQYLDLLLLADEQESMIDRYLDRGDLYALYDDDLKAVCVVTDEGNRTCEIKNIATYPKQQRRGYGKHLIQYVCARYKEDFDTILVGTGDSDWILSFYKNCGFKESDRIKDFFIDNYDHPMFEDGKQLVDMIYLKKEL